MGGGIYRIYRIKMDSIEQWNRMIEKTKEENMDKKNENIQKREEQTKEVMSEIKSEYTKTADFLGWPTPPTRVTQKFRPPLRTG